MLSFEGANVVEVRSSIEGKYFKILILLDITGGIWYFLIMALRNQS
jgi:hypothetical protein